MRLPLSTQNDDSEEAQLKDLLAVFDATPKQTARMQMAIFNALEARNASLLREWIELVCARPLANAAMILAAAAPVIFAYAPLVGIMRQLAHWAR